MCVVLSSELNNYFTACREGMLHYGACAAQ